MLLQELEITLPVLTEMKIVADNQVPCVQVLQQDLLDEGFGALAGKFRIEAQAQQVVDLLGLQVSDFLAKPG